MSHVLLLYTKSGVLKLYPASETSGKLPEYLSQLAGLGLAQEFAFPTSSQIVFGNQSLRTMASAICLGNISYFFSFKLDTGGNLQNSETTE